MGELDVKRRSGFLPRWNAPITPAASVHDCTEENWPANSAATCNLKSAPAR